MGGNDDMDMRLPQRGAAIASTVVRIRGIEREYGVTPESLSRIKQELMTLAARIDLFPLEDFPPPAPGGPRASCLYRLSEDEDHRFALYANSALGRYANAPHNHSTWAVIVGVHGKEPNRLYRRTLDGGVEQTGEQIVEPGSGVTFMPDDLHSLDIKADVPMLNFHMYGLALEKLDKRQYYTASDHTWRHYPAHTDIREARYRP
jgi:predicted metal-dependent enzyme (double-stranded beta helix superfamily)